jgi:hypothetical protein
MRALGSRIDPAEIERLAIMVHRVMSYQSRQFHTLEHVFGFLEGSDAEIALAAVFHDLIYFQVDEGLPSGVAELVLPYLVLEEDSVLLRNDIPETDTCFHSLRTLFGFKPGQRLLPFTGLNEFLSALVMQKSLGGYLPPLQCLAIAVCIEASRPFRGANAAGLELGDALEASIRALVDAGYVQVDEQQARALVGRAIAFANRDVQDFALPDAGQFLSNTWKLLPESNAPLRRKGAFSIREYRGALEKMLGFFRMLVPKNVFHSFRGTPDADAMALMEAGARRNLQYAQVYLQAKLLAVGVLEAIAEISGGDAPMALFMGDVPNEGDEMETLETYLPNTPTPPWIDSTNAVFRLLKDGRLDESTFDLKNSPLALYFYRRLKPGEWAERSASAEDFFGGKLGAAEYLEGFEPSVRRELVEACISMAPTRREPLESWLRSKP